MAIGTSSDFQLNQTIFQTTATITLAQNVNMFNAASNGAVQLQTQDREGDVYQSSFFKDIANIVSRRDPGATSAVTDLELTRGVENSIKLNRRIGPVAQTLDSFKKIAMNPNELSAAVGEIAGQAQARDYVNTSLIAVSAALRSQAGLVHTVAGPLDVKALIRGMAKRGDKGSEIVAFVTHSVPFYEYMEGAIDLGLDSVAGVAFRTASVPFLNRPVLITDSPSLISTGTGTGGIDQYITLGLTSGACLVEESEPREMVTDMVTGLENLAVRMQGEHAYNVAVRGMTYDVAAGLNPTDAALGATGNWSTEYADIKNLGGIVVLTE